MLNLTNTSTDKLQIATDSAATVDVVASWVDWAGSPAAPTPNTTPTAISSAATTDVVATPAASTVRNVKHLTARNKHASLSVNVAVIFNRGGTGYELHKTLLRPGDCLEFIEGIGFFTISSNTGGYNNESTSAQGPGFAADTYLTGSNILLPPGVPIVGTTYRLWFDVTKTAAGLGVPTVTIRFGTAGTIADAAIGTLAFAAGTAVVDSGMFEIHGVFRSVGAGASAVFETIAGFTTNLTTTGLSNGVKAKQSTSGGFDSTVANSQIGASYNGGASAAHTIQLVRAELVP